MQVLLKKYLPMNNYLLTLNRKEKYINVLLDKNVNAERVRTIEDEDAFILIDGYFINEKEFIKKNSTLENIKLEQLLFKLSKRNLNYYGELDGSFNIFFFDKKKNYFLFTNDFWSSRPTYIHKTKNKYLFSNDLYFLKKYIKCELTPNLKKIRELLAWQHIESRSTYYNEIDALGPGVVLRITSDEIHETNLNIVNSSQKFTEYNRKIFREILESAVSSRASHFKKNIVMLSGGLDSSAVAVALKNCAFHNTKTISVNFSHLKEFPNIDEKKYQNIVNSFTNFKKDHIEMQNKSVMGSIEKYVHIFQEPMIIPNLYIFDAVSEHLAKNKVDAVFDGNDGDNVISYGFENIYRQFINLNFISFFNSVFDYGKVHMKSRRRMLNFFLRNSFKKLLGYNSRIKNNSLLTEKLFRNIDKDSPRNIFDSHKSRLNNNLQFIAFSNRHKIFGKLGIEIVSPFYDKDFINFCVNMPPKFKFNKGNTRFILRDYLSNFLGEEHAFRANKSNLTKGLESNFSDFDYEIVMKERENLNNALSTMIDLKKLDAICDKWTKKKIINETDIINLQVFININIFLNSFFK